MKKCIVSLVLALVILLGGCSRVDENDFNVKNVKTHVDEIEKLSKGYRKINSSGNKETREYIKNKFKEYDLKIINDSNDYIQSFDTLVPVINSTPTMEVVDKNGQIVKSYIYKKDFSEKYHDLSGGMTVESKYHVSSKYDIDDSEDGIVLYNYTVDYDVVNRLKKADVKVLITPHVKVDTAPMNGKNEYLHYEVEDSVFEELVKFQEDECKLNIKADISYNKFNSANVVGYVEGSKRELEDSLIIASYFDNIEGKDNDIVGMASVLELARVTSQSKPRRDIIFVALDSHYYNYQGARNFILENHFLKSECKTINIGNIGIDKNKEIQILSFDSTFRNRDYTQQLNTDLKDSGVNCKIYYDKNIGDSTMFEGRRINSVTLSQEDGNVVNSEYDYDNVKKVCGGILNYTNNYAYKTSDFYVASINDIQKNKLKYLPIVLGFILLLALVFCGIVSVIRRKQYNYKGAIFTTILVLLTVGFIIVFNQYLYDDYVDKESKKSPWIESLEYASGIDELIDFSTDETMVCLYSKDGKVYKSEIDYNGKKLSEKLIDKYYKYDKYRIVNGDVYCCRQGKIYVNGQVDISYNNIKDFDFIKSEGKGYFVTIDDKSIVVNKNSKKEIYNYGNVKQAVFTMDRKENLYAVVKQDNIYKYIVLKDGKIKEINIAEMNKCSPTNICIGSESDNSYIFYQDNDVHKYIMINNLKKTEMIQAKTVVTKNDNGFEISNINDVFVDRNCYDKETLSVIVSGSTRCNERSIVANEYKNGSIVGRIDRTFSKQSRFSKAFYDEHSDNGYLAFSESGVINIKSSDVNFRKSLKKDKIYIRTYKIIEMIIRSILILLYHSLVYLPFAAFVLLFHIKNKDKIINKPIVLGMLMIIVLTIQIFMLEYPCMVGREYDYLVINLIVVGLTMLFTGVYIREKRNRSNVKYALVFAIIYVLLITAVYSPYRYL